MRAVVAMGATISLLVICSMAAATMTDMLDVGGTGDEWKTLLRVALLVCYLGGALLGLGGLALIVRRVLS